MRLGSLSRVVLMSLSKNKIPVPFKSLRTSRGFNSADSAPGTLSISRDFCVINDSYLLELYLNGSFSTLDRAMITLNHTSDFETLVANSAEDILDQVSHDLDQDQLIHIVLSLERLMSQEADRASELMEKLQVISEFNHEVASHENYDLLKSRLLELLPEIPVKSVSLIYLGLRKLNEPLTSPVMTQMFVVLRRNLLNLDMQGIANFMQGFNGFNGVMHNEHGRLIRRVTSWSHINFTFYPLISKYCCNFKSLTSYVNSFLGSFLDSKKWCTT